MLFLGEFGSSFHFNRNPKGRPHKQNTTQHNKTKQNKQTHNKQYLRVVESIMRSIKHSLLLIYLCLKMLNEMDTCYN